MVGQRKRLAEAGVKCDPASSESACGLVGLMGIFYITNSPTHGENEKRFIKNERYWCAIELR